jgi:dTDP-4-amino-4,6-dideoxygalactose transaminase
MVKFNDLKAVNALHGDEITEAVARVAASGWYLHGAETEAFEAEYADYIGTRHCVGVGNGLDALTLILRAMLELGRIQPGDEVLVPANTFVATVLAITENGLVPVLVEPDPVTLQIDGNRLEEAVTPRTRVLMLVHLYGRCAMTPEIEAFLRQHPDISLVEDNAQAQGCMYMQTRRTGSLGLVAGHSFYPGKNLGALGDAGAVTTDDAELAAMIRSLGNYGSSRKYVFDHVGRNSRLDEIQAAVLRVKLRHLDANNARRVEIASIYREGLDGLDDGLGSLCGIRAGEIGSNVYHLFPIISDNRDELQAQLGERGVETMIHYPIPPHLQACYRSEPWAQVSLPITERLAKQELSLPIHAAMTDAEARLVVENLHEILTS